MLRHHKHIFISVAVRAIRRRVASRVIQLRAHAQHDHVAGAARSQWINSTALLLAIKSSGINDSTELRHYLADYLRAAPITDVFLRLVPLQQRYPACGQRKRGVSKFEWRLAIDRRLRPTRYYRYRVRICL